jgi:hypothetical protein
MDGQIFGLIMAAIALVAIFELLRRQSLKEKYIVLWAVTAIAIVVIAIHPSMINGVAHSIGIKSGPNVLLLFGGLVVVLVCVQLSVEISRLEDRSRALAEEIGLLRLELDKRTRPQPSDQA